MRQAQRFIAGEGVANAFNHVEPIQHRCGLPAADHLQIDLHDVALGDVAGLRAWPQFHGGSVRAQGAPGVEVGADPGRVTLDGGELAQVVLLDGA